MTAFGNERDVEVPALLAFLRLHPGRVLDVGAHGSAQYYAYEIPEFASDCYHACDLLPDPVVSRIADVYFECSVETLAADDYDAVLCVSMLEHIGKDDQASPFLDQLRIARHTMRRGSAFFFTFPFGDTGRVMGEYTNVTDLLLAAIESAAFVDGFKTHARFFRSETPQAGGWLEINRDYAARCAFQASGAYSVCILEGWRK